MGYRCNSNAGWFYSSAVHKRILWQRPGFYGTITKEKHSDPTTPASPQKLQVHFKITGMTKAVKKSTAKKVAVKAVPAKQTRTAAAKDLTAKHFIERLEKLKSAEELKKIQRYFKTGEGQYGEGDIFIGVKMGQLFSLAKEFAGMPIKEIEQLLESPVHEARAGAVSIMDKESRSKKIAAGRLKEFFDLYIKRHDRINNWDLVDLGCLHLTGSYLFDKPRNILYKLAKSKNLWERRTAIVSTCYFIRQGQTDDAFAIAEILINDKEDLVHKGTGWMLRFAGTKDKKRLISLLDKYAATMPRTLLRYSIEHFSPKEKEHYMGRKKK